MFSSKAMFNTQCSMLNVQDKKENAQYSMLNFQLRKEFSIINAQFSILKLNAG